MTDALLALVPTYGIWLILFVVFFATLAVPLPASILVMTAGGFASVGDMVMWQVQVAALAGCMVGDQVAYGFAYRKGTPFVARLKLRPRLGPPVLRAEHLLEEKGAYAVFLSRTVLSPIGPYMGYLSGALRFNWTSFTIAAGIGAACWALFYSWIGFTFASQIAEIASTISNAIGLILAGCVAIVLMRYLLHKYRNEPAEEPAVVVMEEDETLADLAEVVDVIRAGEAGPAVRP